MRNSADDFPANGPASSWMSSQTAESRFNNSEHIRQILLEVGQAGLASTDLAGFLSEVRLLLDRVLQARNCSVLIKDALTGQARYEFWQDERMSVPGPHAAMRGPAGQVLLTSQPLLLADFVETDEAVRGDAEPEWSSWVGVPLKGSGRTFGTLALHSYSLRTSFDQFDLEFLTSIGKEVAAVLERKRADRALRDSEARYRMLFDHAPDGIVIADAKGEMLDANSSVCRLLGYSRDELLHLNATHIVDPADVPQIEAALADIARSSEHHREWRLIDKHGSAAWVDVTAKKMPDGRVIAHLRDLAERRKAELERAELAAEVDSQKQRLNNIVANVPGIVWELNCTSGPDCGLENFVSEYIQEMLGYSTEEWLATPDFWKSIVRPGHSTRNPNWPLVEAAGERTVEEVPLVAKDGRTVWVEAHSVGIPGGPDTMLGTRGVMIDVTERKRSEDALKVSEDRYRDLVENAIDIIYVHDLEGNYTSVNKAAERITGYARREILGMNMREILAPEYLEPSAQMLASKLDGSENTSYEVEVIAKTGRRITLEVNTRLMLVNGRPVGVQGIARDITERKLLEEKYRQSQKLEAIGMLAGGIAHDFNNLLTAIAGYSEITLAKMPASDPLRPNIQEIKEVGERASALTHQLLAFSRKQVLKPVVHNLNSVLRGIDAMLRRIIRENVELELDLDDELNSIEADPGQLEQVIVNLAVNAQDAMPAGGRLMISTRNILVTDPGDVPGVMLSTGAWVKTTVCDSGEGIDKEMLGRIFEPFFTTKSPGKGSGLGLSTVHGIVKQSGGEIVVNSSRGEGTTFEIYLPAARPASVERKVIADTEADAAGHETILVVEDDDSVRRLVREILAQNGYEVLEAASGDAALAICSERTDPIHLLLTDLVMPKLSGVELTEKVKALHPEARSLVMTGYGNEIPEDSPFRSSTGFIDKPFTPDSL